MLTRGQFLKAAGGGMAGLLVSASRGSASPAFAAQSAFQSFHSRPDLRPPRTSIRYTSSSVPPLAEGYLFIAPTAKPGAQPGVLIVDAHGHPVWFHPLRGSFVTNFRVQRYQGRPVLTWWQGIVTPPGYGWGEGVILDSSYREVARVRAAHGRQADLHEFRLTPWGTALITCHPQTVQANLSAVGGASHGQAFESIIQEIDVRTGELLFEWRSLEHVAIDESYLPPGGIYDYLHVNSIDVLPDGNLLVSGRHTCALYKVHRRSGQVFWRLSGRRSDFAMGRGTRFNWQHDAAHLRGGRITVFDNGAGGRIIKESHSRGLVLHVDPHRRNVSLDHAYRHPTPLRSGAMGSVQVLPDANVMVGWGLVPALSEFSPDGQLLAELSYPWGYNSYRGYRMPWSGTPKDRPAIAAISGNGGARIYSSWNGATEVASWRVSVGSTASEVQPVAVAPRTGFETAIPVSASHGYAVASALDASGNALAHSLPLKF